MNEQLNITDPGTTIIKFPEIVMEEDKTQGRQYVQIVFGWGSSFPSARFILNRLDVVVQDLVTKELFLVSKENPLPLFIEKWIAVGMGNFLHPFAHDIRSMCGACIEWHEDIRRVSKKCDLTRLVTVSVNAMRDSLKFQGRKESSFQKRALRLRRGKQI